jgi:hypothetical protein
MTVFGVTVQIDAADVGNAATLQEYASKCRCVNETKVADALRVDCVSFGGTSSFLLGLTQAAMLMRHLSLTLVLTFAPRLVNQDKSVHSCCTSDAARLAPEKIETLLNQTEPVWPRSAAKFTSRE